MSNKKKFNCVEMKHSAARSIHNRLKGKSPQERLRFWREQERSMSAAIGQSVTVSSR